MLYYEIKCGDISDNESDYTYMRFGFVFLHLVYPLLLVPLDCSSFVFASTVFSNVYL